MLIDGIHIPLTLPFYGDGRLYLRKLEHNVRRYSLSPASALVAFAPHMEAASLTDAEVVEAMQAISDAAAKEKVLIAGLPRTSVFAALALAEAAARAGFDVVLAAAPADVSSLNAGERMLWFRAIADRSPLPVMLYSEEQGVGSTLTLTEVAELALHPNILGMYDAVLSAGRYAALVEATKTVRREVTVTPVFAPVTGRMLAPEMVETKLVTIGAVGGGVALAPAGPQIRTRTKSVGFQVVAAGRIAGSVERLAAGVPALMPSLAAAAPQACHEVYAAFRDGDPALAALKAERLLAADDLTVTLGIAGIKHGCDLNGFAGGPPRLPRLALAAVDRERMEQALGNVHN